MNDQKPFPSPNPMLARLRRDNLPPRLAEMWDMAMRDRDEAVLFEVAGNAPEVIEWYYDSFYGEMFHQGRVEVRLKQIARYKLSKMHGCAFCNRGNEKAALAAGVAKHGAGTSLPDETARRDDPRTPHRAFVDVRGPRRSSDVRARTRTPSRLFFFSLNLASATSRF